MPKPLIATALWFTPLPPNYQRIGISRGTPRSQPAGFRIYRKLAPGTWFASVSAEEYNARYNEILAKLDARMLVADLLDLAVNKVPTLLCFEKPGVPGQWCHRSLVARWLSEAGFPVYEYGYESCPPSEHPLLPAELRRPLAAE